MTCECRMQDGRLKISGELTIYAATEMKDRVLKELKRRRKPAIDLSGVAEIDTAGVQILLLAKRVLESTGGRFTVHDPSPAAREALQLCGLADWLAATPVAEAAS